MSPTQKMSWVLCALFSLVPSLYFLLVISEEIQRGYSWGWMIAIGALVPYVLALAFQAVVVASTPRRTENWPWLAAGYAAYPLLIALYLSVRYAFL